MSLSEQADTIIFASTVVIVFISGVLLLLQLLYTIDLDLKTLLSHRHHYGSFNTKSGKLKKIINNL